MAKRKKMQTQNKPALVNSSTQTSLESPKKYVIRDFLQPKVAIEVLSEMEICKWTTKRHSGTQTSRESTSHSGKQFRSSVPNEIHDTPHVSEMQVNSKQPVISRLPPNYKVFVKPITNNERVNSTLETGRSSTANSMADAIVSKRKRVRFSKPGPLCSKQKFADRLENMRIPVMLEKSGQEDELNLSLPTLGTIAEQADENCSSPQPSNMMTLNSPQPSNMMTSNQIQIGHEDLEIPSVENILHFEDVIRPEIQNRLVSPNLVECRETHTNGQNIQISEENMTPREVHVEFEHLGVLSTPSPHNTGTQERAQSEYGSRNSDPSENCRHIKIIAKTVHIHNHFYSD